MHANSAPTDPPVRTRTVNAGDDFLRALSASLVEASESQTLQQMLDAITRTLRVDHAVLARPPQGSEGPVEILHCSTGSVALADGASPLVRIALEQVVNQGYANCPAKASHLVKEAPGPGSPRIESFLGMPVFDRRRNLVAALLILDHKVLGYTNFLRGVLALFASRLGAELEREELARAMAESSAQEGRPREDDLIPGAVRIADTLELKARFEELCEDFACLSEKSARMSQENFWESALGRISQCAEAGRAYLIRLNPDRLAPEHVYQCAIGETPAAEPSYFDQLYGSPESQGWNARLASGTAMEVPVVAELENTFARERHILSSAGVKSLHAIALREGRQTIGFLVLEYLDCHERRLGQVQFHFRLLAKVLAKMLLCARGQTALTDGMMSMAAEGGRITPRITPALPRPTAGRIQPPVDRKPALRVLDIYGGENMPSLDSLLEHVQAMVYVVGVSGQILFASPGSRTLLGINEQELVGRSFLELLHPRDVPKHQRSIARALSKGEGEQAMEYRLRHSNGTWQDHQINTHVVRDGNGEFLYIVGIAQDVSLYKRTEQRLLEFKDTAQSASRAKDRFLAHLDHELRMHVQPVMGYAELLRSAENLSEKQRDDLGVILECSRRIAAILQGFNDAMGTTQESAAGRGRVELPALLDRLKRDFENACRAKGLRFLHNRSADLPRSIPGNERQLEEVVRGLLENAVTYTESGDVCLNVNMQEGALLLEVRDTGEGIALDEQDSVFEPFYQGIAGRRINRGMGLGLSIARTLVSRMGGQLLMESGPDSGTRLWFTVPLAESAAQPGKGSPPLQAPTLEVHDVLVAEPNPNTRRLLRDILEPHGLIVHECATGSEAMHLARSLQPNAIIMDLRLAGSNGQEVARLLHNLAGQRLKCLVALSDSAFRRLHTVTRSTGWHAQFVKPIDSTALVEVLATHLNLPGKAAPAPDQRLAG